MFDLTTVFFDLQWNLYSRGNLGVEVSLEWLGWALLMINQQMKHFSFILPRNLLQLSQAAS